jgi:hypothetical protein
VAAAEGVTHWVVVSINTDAVTRTCAQHSPSVYHTEKNRQAAPERTRQEPHKRHAPATPEGSLVDFTEEEL